ncbi:MAG: hypothetical protein E4H01_12445 [Lysobacterales bacterium]|nr:MAG: hypothetical protein E4H01_12445 [Xanthomonadales bacterium]
MMPETVTYRDLGLDVPEDTRRVERGPEWFRNQPEDTQRAMMGTRGFEAWKDGKFEIEDMAKITTDPIWGEAATQKPLKELIGV